MIAIVDYFIEDIQPRYAGDNIQDYVLPGTFPRRVGEVVFYHPNERIELDCNACHRAFTMPAKTYQPLHNSGARILCWTCYNRRKQRAHERRMLHVLRYISGQENFIK